MINRDVLNRAYATISSLRQNLPERFYVSQPYVDEYHRAIEKLANEGLDLGEFRVPAGELRRRPMVHNTIDGTTEYGRVAEVERSLFLVKIDAVLAYLKLLDEESGRRS
jgi:hypothetical protein